MRAKQLALKVGLPDLAAFDNFFPGSNREAVAAIRELASHRSGLLYVHGPPGTGKSHLLYAATKEAGRRKRPAVYVSCAAAPGTGDLLDLPGDGLVCVDDIGEALTETEARALFSLYERMRSRSGSLVVSSRFPPTGVDWVLSDLRSRIRSDLVYHLAAFTENELEEALRLRARHRGIHLSDEVMRFVLHRYERSSASLFHLLDRIDTESLARKRRVTVPFLRSLEDDSENSPEQ